MVKNWAGQSIATWYLDLPDISDPHSNLSEFSKNLTKYGLRRTSAVEEKGERGHHHFYPGVKTSHVWEHDDMTQHQAMDLVSDVFKKYWSENNIIFTASGFSATVGLVQYQTNDIKVPLASKIWYDDYHDNINIFIKNYKEKKLGWTNDKRN